MRLLFRPNKQTKDAEVATELVRLLDPDRRSEAIWGKERWAEAEKILDLIRKNPTSLLYKTEKWGNSPIEYFLKYVNKEGYDEENAWQIMQAMMESYSSRDIRASIKDVGTKIEAENQEANTLDKFRLLHTACSNRNIPLRYVELIVKYDPESVKQKDIQGYFYPLHVAIQQRQYRLYQQHPERASSGFKRFAGCCKSQGGDLRRSNP